MEARLRRPILGMAALCVSLVLSASESASAQYAPQVVAESQVAMLQPTMTPPVPAAAAQPFVQGRPGATGPVMQAAPGMMAGATAAGPSGGQSENFVVLCNDPQLTEVVSKAAERFRRDLAIHWLGHELPPWSRRCPIYVTAGPSLGAGGETQFALYNGNVGDWKMSVQGTPERILDSVLPHEITHTLLASHFAPLNVHVPRWADEGACTTVEHSSEQDKHKSHLVQYLSTGRGLAFHRMFSLKDYPRDILPLYAQGHSVVEFLIAQGGPRQFVKFLEDGMRSGQWEPAIQKAYGYDSMGQLQIKWNQWIAAGRGSVEKYAGKPGAAAAAASTLASEDASPSVPSLESDLQVSTQPAKTGEEEIAEGSSIQLVAHGKEAASTASASAIATGEDSSEGFYRKRLESKMRDIVRVESNASATPVSAAPAARTAALDRNVGRSSMANGQISGRATARPQEAQSTPMRVIDWGKDAPEGGLQPIYR